MRLATWEALHGVCGRGGVRGDARNDAHVLSNLLPSPVHLNRNDQTSVTKAVDVTCFRRCSEFHAGRRHQQGSIMNTAYCPVERVAHEGVHFHGSTRSHILGDRRAW